MLTLSRLGKLKPLRLRVTLQNDQQNIFSCYQYLNIASDGYTLNELYTALQQSKKPNLRWFKDLHSLVGPINDSGGIIEVRMLLWATNKDLEILLKNVPQTPEKQFGYYDCYAYNFNK